MLTDEEKNDLLDGLKTAKFSGALSVSYRDRTVTYRSMAELDQAIRDLEIELGIRTSSLSDRQQVGRTDKDL